MAVMTIRNIDDAIKNRLRNLGQAIHERFGALGGVDLPDRPREPIRAVDFGE